MPGPAVSSTGATLLPAGNDWVGHMADVARAVAREESARDRERYRGIKYLRRRVTLPTQTQTRVSLLDGIAPEPGWVWVIKTFGCQLATAGTGQVYVTSDSTGTLTGVIESDPVASFTTSSTTQVQIYGTGGLVLEESDGVFLNFTQNIVGYTLRGWACIAERVGELA